MSPKIIAQEGAEEARQALGLLMEEVRLRRFKESKQEFGERVGLSPKTIASVEKGEGFVMPSTFRTIESALGWRQGIITELLKEKQRLLSFKVDWDYLADPRRTPLKDDNSPPVLEVGQVLKAAHLTDAELMQELSYRMLFLKK